MLSLKAGKELCDMLGGGTLYFQQKRNLDGFTPSLEEVSGYRSRYNLSADMIKILHKAILEVHPPEDSKLRGKYYKILQDLKLRYYNEFDLVGTDSEFQINLPKKRSEFAGSILNQGSTGAGKGHFAVELILRNWKGKKSHRRPVIWISPEADIDKTLKPLKAARYSRMFTPIDVSHDTISDFMEGGKTLEDFLQEKILSEIEKAIPSTLIVADDIRDSQIAFLKTGGLHKKIEMLARVGRHKNVSIMLINHLILAGNYTKLLGSSQKWRILYPRANKSKIVQFLHTHLQLKLSEGKKIVERIAEHSRWMAVHMHSPNAIISAKLSMLL